MTSFDNKHMDGLHVLKISFVSLETIDRKKNLDVV